LLLFQKLSKKTLNHSHLCVKNYPNYLQLSSVIKQDYQKRANAGLYCGFTPHLTCGQEQDTQIRERRECDVFGATCPICHKICKSHFGRVQN